MTAITGFLDHKNNQRPWSCKRYWTQILKGKEEKEKVALCTWAGCKSKHRKRGCLHFGCSYGSKEIHFLKWVWFPVTRQLIVGWWPGAAMLTTNGVRLYDDIWLYVTANSIFIVRHRSYTQGWYVIPDRRVLCALLAVGVDSDRASKLYIGKHPFSLSRRYKFNMRRFSVYSQHVGSWGRALIVSSVFTLRIRKIWIWWRIVSIRTLLYWAPYMKSVQPALNIRNSSDVLMVGRLPKNKGWNHAVVSRSADSYAFSIFTFIA